MEIWNERKTQDLWEKGLLFKKKKGKRFKSRERSCQKDGDSEMMMKLREMRWI